MAVVRQVIGESLRGQRLRRGQTLRQVSQKARVSLGYLSEVERGQKEASSELLGAICQALDLELSELFADVSSVLRREEVRARIGALAGSRGGFEVATAQRASGPQVRLASVAAA